RPGVGASGLPGGWLIALLCSGTALEKPRAAPWPCWAPGESAVRSRGDGRFVCGQWWQRRRPIIVASSAGLRCRERIGRSGVALPSRFAQIAAISTSPIAEECRLTLREREPPAADEPLDQTLQLVLSSRTPKAEPRLVPKVLPIGWRPAQAERNPMVELELAEPCAWIEVGAARRVEQPPFERFGVALGRADAARPPPPADRRAYVLLRHHGVERARGRHRVGKVMRFGGSRCAGDDAEREANAGEQYRPEHERRRHMRRPPGSPLAVAWRSASTKRRCCAVVRRSHARSSGLMV